MRLAFLIPLVVLALSVSGCRSRESQHEIVQDWTTAVSAGRDRDAAAMLLPGAVVVHGGATMALTTEQDALGWIQNLPCAAEIVDFSVVGSVVETVLRLSNRPSTACDGPGEEISVGFEVVDGKIARLVQAGAPAGTAVLE